MKLDFTSNVSLAPLTTFGVGGEARFFIEAQSVEEVYEALNFARTNSLSICVLGGGSNIVVADTGYDGLVLAVRIHGITFENQDGHTFVTAGAGVVWDELVIYSIEHGFAGLECLSGVPGTVGGAVVANLGCYGAQCSDTFVSADVLDLKDANSAVRVLKNENCHFSYHESVFNHEPGRYLVLRATFALVSNGAPRLAYRDNRFNLATLATKNSREPTLLDIRNAVLDVREQKGALIMNGRTSYKCAGSFFHMPYVSPTRYAEIVQCAKKCDPEKEERLRPWAWEQADGSYKLAPGFLLEYTKFQKGYVRGAVGISPRHTLTIINIGGARAQDIALLARDMQDAVKNIFGVRLEREVEYIGEVERNG